MDPKEVCQTVDAFRRQVARAVEAFKWWRSAAGARAELRRLRSAGTTPLEIMEHWIIVEDDLRNRPPRLMTRERAEAELGACVVIPSDLYRPHG